MLSTRSGRSGINLVSVHVIIIFDSDWNQPAMDRADRIGKKKQVRVFRLVAGNTVDEKIVDRAEIKLRLAKLVIHQGRLVGNTSVQPDKDEIPLRVFHPSNPEFTEGDSEMIITFFSCLHPDPSIFIKNKHFTSLKQD